MSVRGSVLHTQLVGPRLTHQQGARATTIKVHGVVCAELHQELAQLIKRHATRMALTAVDRDHEHLQAVLADAHGGARFARAGSGDNRTVRHQTLVTADREVNIRARTHSHRERIPHCHIRKQVNCRAAREKHTRALSNRGRASDLRKVGGNLSDLAIRNLYPHELGVNGGWATN